MKVVAIIQARMGSTRLPGKVLRQVLGKTLLAHVVCRARRVNGLAEIVVATTVEDADGAIVRETARLGVVCFRGDARDVLDRYYRAAEAHDADVVVRLTADCPVLDHAIVDRVLQRFLADPGLDYAATGSTYPEGYGLEVVSGVALARAWREAQRPSEREHVTPYIWRDPGRFKIARVEHVVDASRFRLTVDEECDLEVVSRLVEALTPLDPAFGIEAATSFLSCHPDIAGLNAHIPRLAGYWQSVADESRG